MQNRSRQEKEKETRRAEIVAAAEKVFCRKGFENASMEEIAREAEFTKRTIYQYFVNKEDLFCAVVLRGFNLQHDYLMGAIAKGQTGFEKLSLAAAAYHQFCTNFPDLFRLMNHAGHVVGQSEPSQSGAELRNLGPGMFKEYAKVIEAGKADGSIRADVDALMGACSVAFVLTGFFRMLSEAGPSFTKSRGLDQDEFVRFTLSLLGDALSSR